MKKKFWIVLAVLTAIIFMTAGCAKQPSAENKGKIKLSVVIMPVFEIDEMSGDFPGEAQLFYEEYFSESTSYDISGDPSAGKIYVQDDMGLYLLGQGKVTAAVNSTALLSDDRFDFSDTTFLLSGCAGSAKDFGVAGDVYIISSAIDYDLGHTADIRDLADDTASTWFRAEEYDTQVYHELNPELVSFAYELTKDLTLATTEDARACMARNFDNADWAVRDPKVLKGASITSDNYWKGEYNHRKANEITESFHAPDPYAATEMEDAAVMLAFEKMGYADQMIMTRSSVNMDVFLDGQTPETLWGGVTSITSNEFDGFTDIFSVAMENNFLVGKTIIEALQAQ